MGGRSRNTGLCVAVLGLGLVAGACESEPNCSFFTVTRTSSGGLAGDGDGVTLTIGEDGAASLTQSHPPGRTCRGTPPGDLVCQVWFELAASGFWFLPATVAPEDNPSCCCDWYWTRVSAEFAGVTNMVDFCQLSSEGRDLRAALDEVSAWLLADGTCE